MQATNNFMRTIFHLDLDAFFVSVERILNPSLNGKAVIVGGNPKYGRGVVAACSYEAREYGLHSAMPITTAYKLCPNGIYLNGNFKEYIHFSKAVENILKCYAPVIEQASIDEFYMDFTGCQIIYGPLFSFASTIQQEIFNKLSLPCSIGIGSNKTIAKIASDSLKPKGITYVLPSLEKEFLEPMPIEVIPGVGKATKKLLNDRGIYLVKHITSLPQDYFSTILGKFGLELWRKANGKGAEYLSSAGKQKRISKESTFSNDIISKEELHKHLFYLTGKVCHSLRKKTWHASRVEIKLRYTDFITVSRSKSIKPSDDDNEIFNIAWTLMENAITRRVGIRLIGLGLSKFTSATQQENLFEDLQSRRKKMLKAVTKIRDKYGYNALLIGSSGLNR